MYVCENTCEKWMYDGIVDEDNGLFVVFTTHTSLMSYQVHPFLIIIK